MLLTYHALNRLLERHYWTAQRNGLSFALPLDKNEEKINEYLQNKPFRRIKPPKDTFEEDKTLFAINEDDVVMVFEGDIIKTFLLKSHINPLSRIINNEEDFVQAAQDNCLDIRYIFLYKTSKGSVYRARYAEYEMHLFMPHDELSLFPLTEQQKAKLVRFSAGKYWRGQDGKIKKEYSHFIRFNGVTYLYGYDAQSALCFFYQDEQKKFQMLDSLYDEEVLYKTLAAHIQNLPRNELLSWSVNNGDLWCSFGTEFFNVSQDILTRKPTQYSVLQEAIQNVLGSFDIRIIKNASLYLKEYLERVYVYGQFQLSHYDVHPSIPYLYFVKKCKQYYYSKEIPATLDVCLKMKLFHPQYTPIFDQLFQDKDSCLKKRYGKEYYCAKYLEISHPKNDLTIYIQEHKNKFILQTLQRDGYCHLEQAQTLKKESKKIKEYRGEQEGKVRVPYVILNQHTYVFKDDTLKKTYGIYDFSCHTHTIADEKLSDIIEQIHLQDLKIAESLQHQGTVIHAIEHIKDDIALIDATLFTGERVQCQLWQDVHIKTLNSLQHDALPCSIKKSI